MSRDDLGCRVLAETFRFINVLILQSRISVRMNLPFLGMLVICLLSKNRQQAMPITRLSQNMKKLLQRYSY